ncbi:transposase [Nocardia rhamnosiphila]
MWFTQGGNGSGCGHSEPVDHAIGRSRGGPTTKIHLACDGRGRPLTLLLTAGNVNDCTMFTQVLAGIWMPKPGRGQSWKRPRRVLADKGYSTRAIRAHLRTRGIAATIPERLDQQADRRRRGSAGGRPPVFDPVVYRRRNVVERCSTGSSSTARSPPAMTVRMNGCRPGRWSDPRYDWPSGLEFDLSTTVRGGACCRRTRPDVSR